MTARPAWLGIAGLALVHATYFVAIDRQAHPLAPEAEAVPGWRPVGVERRSTSGQALR